MEDNDKYIVKIKTVQISAFKMLIEALKEIFRDLVFRITKNTDDKKGGLSVSALNCNGNVFVKLKLPAENFEEFYCEPPNNKNTFSIAVNMVQFYKLIKTVSNDDTLTLFVEENKQNELGIQLENAKKKYRTKYKLTLLDLPTEEPRTIPESKFNFVITMLSQDFHNLIKNMSIIADDVDIKYIDMADTRDTLIFTCKGDFASQETQFSDSTKDVDNQDRQAVKIIHDGNSGCTNQIIQGVYQLKTLSLFSKCSSLSNNLEIYMKDNFPLLIKYMIANLGHVYLILSSVVDKNGYSDMSDSDNDSEDDNSENGSDNDSDNC